MKALAIICIAMAIPAAVSASYVSNEVTAREKLLVQVQAQISSTEERIQIMRAEWAHLSGPSRLEELGNSYLDIKPIRPQQYADISSLPYASPRVTKPVPDIPQGIPDTTSPSFGLVSMNGPEPQLITTVSTTVGSR